MKVFFTLKGEIISSLYVAGECHSPLQYRGLSSDKLILAYPPIPLILVHSQILAHPPILFILVQPSNY